MFRRDEKCRNWPAQIFALIVSETLVSIRRPDSWKGCKGRSSKLSPVRLEQTAFAFMALTVPEGAEICDAGGVQDTGTVAPQQKLGETEMSRAMTG